MAANPALVATAFGKCPAPFPEEAILCQREGISFEIDGVRTASARWKAKGAVFLSNVRMVFVADAPDPESGLECFDLPLVYLRKDKFNQPIFGCNNISGECWPAVDGGGPSGTLPPHLFRLYFTQGGVGTLLPLYFTALASARRGEATKSSQSSAQQHAPINANSGQAFVDPNDPTTVFLSPPAKEEQRLPDAPKYASNYGADEDEAYLPLI